MQVITALALVRERLTRGAWLLPLLPPLALHVTKTSSRQLTTALRATMATTASFQLLDSHNHYQRALRASPAPPPLAGVMHCPMAIDESDWSHMTALLDREDVVVAGVGLHPWFAHKRSADWASRLAVLLEAEPRLIVGEIGLDKVARTPDTGKVEWGEQMLVFEEQMALASSLGRPVSMHCVKAHGTLFDWLRAKQQQPDKKTTDGVMSSSSSSSLPPALALHSFTGSVEMARAFLSLSGTEVYLGFSAPVNMKTEGMANKMRDVLKHVPLDRVLLESDLEDGSQVLKDELMRACVAIAQAKQQQQEGGERKETGAEEGRWLTTEDIARITAANGRRFCQTRRSCK